MKYYLSVFIATLVLVGFNIIFPFAVIYEAFFQSTYADDVKEIYNDYREAIRRDEA